jgi:hypothetical protein
MKSIVLLIPFLFLFSNEQYADDALTRYFPKQELKATNIPNRNHVWVFIMAGQSNMAWLIREKYLC